MPLDGARLLESVSEHLQKWRIEPEQLEILEEIGVGSTSVVYTGRIAKVPKHAAGRLREGHLVAVKEMDNGRIDESIALQFTRELAVWPQVDHPHILRFHGFSLDASTLRICSEYCAGGALFDHLHNNWHVPISWAQRRKILIDTASAVDYLHNFRKPIMHRDLKSLNLFLLSPLEDDAAVPEVRLADFGFARFRVRQEWSDLTEGAGTPHWMAPEVSKGTQYHEKVDVFSFAVIMYEVVCRHMAFESLDPDSAMTEIVNGERPSLEEEWVPPETPRELLDLITRCWQQDPIMRPTMGEALEELRTMQWPP